MNPVTEMDHEKPIAGGPFRKLVSVENRFAQIAPG
jgi:hypothetical protein